MWRSAVVYGAWSAGENYPFGTELANLLYLSVEWMNFTIDAQLANSPRYQLGVLRAEIEYQDGLKRFGQEIASFLLYCSLNLTGCPGKRRVYVSERAPTMRWSYQAVDGGDERRDILPIFPLKAPLLASTTGDGIGSTVPKLSTMGHGRRRLWRPATTPTVSKTIFRRRAAR